MSVTLKDIAGICKTSTATVSRALRDDPLISVAMRKKIAQVAARLEYQPNLLASSLRKSETKTVWVVLASLRDTVDREIVHAATRFLAEAGYDTVAAFHMSEDERYLRMTNRLMQGISDGALIVPRRQLGDFEMLRRLALRKHPTVLLDVDVEGLGLPLVTNDNEASERELVAQCIARGCREFIVLHIHPNTVAALRRRTCLDEVRNARRWTIAEEVTPKWLAGGRTSEPLAIMGSSQEELLQFSNQWSAQLSNRPLIFGCYDDWIGGPAPAREVLVAVQDYQEIARAATDILLRAIADPAQATTEGRLVVKVKHKEVRVVKV